MINQFKFFWLAMLALSLILITGCSTSKNRGKTKDGVEDFDAFYQKFHTDRDFQFSRLKFPMGGSSIDDNGEKKWTKKNWQPLKVKVFDVDKSKYKVTFKKTDKTFVQKVWIEGSGFSSECRFELINGKWMLVYSLEENL
ncbi:MAG: hypothetical protein IPN29_03090 [Saprospiraceae bacterium]|nr:hypothetical protein [Saprospiraceae bacterium]